MTNPTLERAERAVEDATFNELMPGQALIVARAVLMAVREIHEEEAVMYAGRDAGEASGFNGSRKYGMAFSAMIDAILSEGVE